MTEEEHHTRAMLMGKIYDPVDHTYSWPNSNGLPTFVLTLDADTLEPLTEQEARERFNKASKRRNA